MPVVKAYITPEAYVGIMRKTLTVDHGAVRSLDNCKLFELPRIIMENTLEPTAGSVQTAGIQKIKALSKTSSDIKKISTDVLRQVNILKSGVQTIQTLSYLNTALSGINIAASAIGDALILDKLSDVQKEVELVISSNQTILDKVNDIRNITVNEKLAEFQKMNTKLYNYIQRMKTETITDGLLGDVFDELMEASAFLAEMKRNFLIHACDEISPELIFELASTYICTASLYAICYKMHHKGDKAVLDDRTAKDLGYPIDLLLEDDMYDALYKFYYNRLPGLPIERDLQNSITLPIYGISIGKNVLDSAKVLACSQNQLPEKVEVIIDDQLLAVCM